MTHEVVKRWSLISDKFLLGGGEYAVGTTGEQRPIH